MSAARVRNGRLPKANQTCYWCAVKCLLRHGDLGSRICPSVRLCIHSCSPRPINVSSRGMRCGDSKQWVELRCVVTGAVWASSERNDARSGSHEWREDTWGVARGAVALSQTGEAKPNEPFLAVTPYFCNTHLNIIFPSSCRSHKRSFPFILCQLDLCMHFLFPPSVLHISRLFRP
jgi:hypothetical protein